MKTNESNSVSHTLTHRNLFSFFEFIWHRFGAWMTALIMHSHVPFVRNGDVAKTADQSLDLRLVSFHMPF